MRITEKILHGLSNPLAKRIIGIIAIATIAMAIIQYMSLSQIRDFNGNIFVLLVGFIGEALFMLLPAWLLPLRFFKSAVVCIVWLVALFMLVNLWYLRAWGDTMGVEALELIGNVNGMLIHSIEEVWHRKDLGIILTACVATIAIFFISPFGKGKSLGIRSRLLLAALSLLGLVSSQLIIEIKDWRYTNNTNLQYEGMLTHFSNRVSLPIITNKMSLFHDGITVFLAKSVAGALATPGDIENLSSQQIKTVKDFIRSNNVEYSISDSLKSSNRAKNVVLIVVESLNAEAVGKNINGFPVTPVLDSLLEAEGTVSALNVITQVRRGGSGDGQFITNTGLQPLERVSTSMKKGSRNQFPSLTSKFSDKDPIIVFAEDASGWNERGTFSNFGFKKLFTVMDFPEMKEQFGADAAMFRFAAEKLSEVSQPFFLEMITASMHLPFVEPTVEVPDWLQNASDLNRTEKNYYTVTNYFDRELGLFIESLRSKKLLDDTQIYIASDHSQISAFGESTVTKSLHDTDFPMVFIATNTGISEKVSRTVGQIDLYPTILLLSGYYTPDGNTYNGVGTPVLNPELDSAYSPEHGIKGNPDSGLLPNQRKAYEVSDIIIRSDWFRHRF